MKYLWFCLFILSWDNIDIVRYLWWNFKCLYYYIYEMILTLGDIFNVVYWDIIDVIEMSLMLDLEISVILFYRDDNDVVFIERYLFFVIICIYDYFFYKRSEYRFKICSFMHNSLNISSSKTRRFFFLFIILFF